MNIHFTVIIGFAVAGLAIITGIILFQIYLSKKDSRWLGLVLPAILFLLSFLYPLNMVGTGVLWQDVWAFVTALLLSNIFTVILLVIYAALRGSRRKKAQLEKMNIQDLN